jgi:hypothetical protein
LVTVIDIDAKQYARIEIGGLFVIFERGAGVEALEFDLDARNGSLGEGDDRPFKLRISISGILMLYSSFFLSSMVTVLN